MKNKNNIICSISDIHLRFGSRHEEFQIVFDRIIDDLKKEKPRRIVFTGDLFHIKINLSPKAISLAGKQFLKKLAEIAPVDIIVGNHDTNLRSQNSIESQGDAITPIIELMDNGYILTKEDLNKPLPIPDGKRHGIYFYKESGFYNIDDDLVYGVYSLLDGEILTLTEKEPNKKYIALFHGPIYGCKGDNGYEMKRDELTKITCFNNFDIGMFGDIHEYQTFLDNDGKESRAYPGSCIQQHYGESMDKGYLLWNLDDCTHERRLISNDYGFFKMVIVKGEDVYDRLENLQFSNDKKKTKIWVQIEEDEENYSVEKENQIVKWIKNRHGGEHVEVEFIPTKRESVFDTNLSAEEIIDESNDKFEDLLVDFLQQNNYENIEDVKELSADIDKQISEALESFDVGKTGKLWEINSVEISNLFSLSVSPIIIDFDKFKGLTGIFGQNYSGKSNIIKAIVWGLYQQILDGGDNYRVVNMYTGINKGYILMYFTISGIKYKIYREIKIKPKKSTKSSLINNEIEYDVSYKVKYEYQKLCTDNDNNEFYKWIDAESEEAATEKKEIKKLIENTIGNFEDFTKVVLQSQSGSNGYLSLKQQPKNDLINKYLGLEIFRDRYELANDTFKSIKAVQKQIGDPVEIEKSIQSSDETKLNEEKMLSSLNDEKAVVDKQIDIENERINEENKKLLKILVDIDETDIDKIQSKIKDEEFLIEKENKEVVSLEDWLSKNFKKELLVSDAKYNTTLKVNTEIEKERQKFQTEKQEYQKLEEFIKSNPKKEEIETSVYESSVAEINAEIINIKNNIKIAKGEKCPTCGHIKHEANPELEKEYVLQLKSTEIKLVDINNKIKDAKLTISHNIQFDKNSNKIESIRLSLVETKNNIEKLKELLEINTKNEEIASHNTVVNNNSLKLSSLKNSVLSRNKRTDFLNTQIDNLNKNKEAIDNNKMVLETIKQIKDGINSLKITNLHLDSKIKDLIGKIKVLENNIENFKDKLLSIQNAERVYKKYSIYLQAVHRDGIPSKIIKKKLPVINYRINTVLKNIVSFKVELYVDDNGDIKEVFYYSHDKTDNLPLSMGSGAQKFIVSIAIMDSMHYISKLTKPSFRIIDEGFGTLDNEKIIDIVPVINFLKNRYKNILILTHRNEIKDSVDNIIQVIKSTDGISADILEKNKEAGITYCSIN